MPRHLNKNWWPHQVTIESSKWPLTDDKDNGWIQRRNWLREHLGTMSGIYYINGDTYCFTDEKDMLHFLLVNQ